MDPASAISKVLGIDKLIDYGANGVGAIAGPLLAPWKASREGKARLTAAQVDAQVREIEARADASALNVIAEAQAEAREYLLPADADIHAKLDITLQDIAQSFEFQGRKRLANARAVLEAAADELGDREVDDHEPDPDWTARLFDIVQDVSSEDLQKIYAKILAGEVESPGRTSLRTLDTLRNMTKIDAELFKGICNLVIQQDCVFFDESYLKNFDDLSYSKLIHLQDCGLVTIQSFLTRQITVGENKECALPYLDGALLIAGVQGASEVLGIPVALLTTAGRELFRIVDCTPHWGYLRTFSKFLESKHCRLEYLESVVPLSDGRIRYSNRILIEPEPDQAEGDPRHDHQPQTPNRSGLSS